MEAIGKIRQLSQEVIGQIAAGEVVERPAAAIKELVENSMDAGATAVTVDVKEGGLLSFRVVDNGSGIAPSDLRMAFERHATSKIRTAEELYGVKTLGFRGEALASIAAVSKVTCVTRTKNEENGMLVQNNGGVIVDLHDAACPEGTSFLVKELFYNAPVRRKFMKKPVTETSQITDLMMRMILSHPQVSFRYMADGKTVYFSAGDGKIESAVMSIYGLATLKQLKKIDGHGAGMVLQGYVGVGDAARGNRAHQSFFINGRAMKSELLTNALEEACRHRVMIGRYPMCALYLDMPYEAVDVNVHPNKWEVRFQNERELQDAFRQIIYDTLEADTPLSDIPKLFLEEKKEEEHRVTVEPPAPPVTEKPSAAPVIQPAPVPVVVKSYEPSGALHEAALRHAEPAPVVSAVIPPVPVMQEKIEQVTDIMVEKTFEQAPVRLVGVVFDTYIIVEYMDQMLLCDQHAVHERILFDRLMKACEENNGSQALLMPQVVQLSHRAFEVWQEYAEDLDKAGFTLEAFGDQALQLRGVPMVLGEPKKGGNVLRDALDELDNAGGLSHQRAVERIMQSACKHAVKGGEKLPMDALADLVRTMISDGVTPTCPHGRPLVVALSHTELDKRFRRIVT